MLSVTIEADDSDALKISLLELCNSLGIQKPLSLPIDANPKPKKSKSKKVTDSPDLPASPVDGSPTGGDAATPDSSHSDPSTVPSLDEDEPSSPRGDEGNSGGAESTPDKEKVFAALKKLSTDKGILSAKKLLEDFGCARISELKEEQFQEFIEACEKVA